MPTALERLTEDERKEYWACLALKYAQNIGVRTVAKLLKEFGSAFDAVHSLSEWGKIGASHRIKHIQDNSWRDSARKEWENARDLDAQIILWTSEHYPRLLQEIPDPPSFFYALGNLDLLKSPSIGIVGSRISSQTGQNASDYLAKGLSSCGVTVISGMARGIDRSAHYGSIRNIGSTIGVLGSGIDVIYPQANSDIYFEIKNNGLLISEFSPGMPPDPTNFPIRNRIISGLSYGIIVIEADLKSGSLITARLANEQGRQVYAIPGAMGSPYSKGCQELIRQGAKAVFRVEDVLEDLLPILKADLQSLQKNVDLYQPTLFDTEESENTETKTPKKSSAKNSTKPLEYLEKKELIIKNPLENLDSASLEYKIIECILSEKLKKIQFDDLCQKLNLSAQEINVALTLMELNDQIKRFDGAWFGLPESK